MKPRPLESNHLIVCVQLESSSLPTLGLREPSLSSLDLATEWRTIGAAKRIEAIEGATCLPAPYKRPTARFPDDEALCLENTQGLAHGSKTHPELAVQVHLARQQPTWLQLTALYALEHRISNLQIEWSCLEPSIVDHANLSHFTNSHRRFW